MALERNSDVRLPKHYRDSGEWNKEKQDTSPPHKQNDLDLLTKSREVEMATRGIWPTLKLKEWSTDCEISMHRWFIVLDPPPKSGSVSIYITPSPWTRPTSTSQLSMERWEEMSRESSWPGCFADCLLGVTNTLLRNRVQPRPVLPCPALPRLLDERKGQVWHPKAEGRAPSGPRRVLE